VSYPPVYGPLYESYDVAGGGIVTGFYLLIEPAIEWTAENGATVNALEYWQADRRGPPNVTPWYLPMAGYFQRWPPSWNADTLRGMTQATVADTWAYTNRQLKSCLRQEVLADGPYAYWPCSDAQDDLTGVATTGAANIAPLNPNTLNVTESKNGNGGATQQFGANSAGLPGDQTTTVTTSSRSSSSPGMWSQAGVTDTTEGYCLLCQDANFPSLSYGVTVSCFFQITSATLEGSGGDVFLVISSPIGYLVDLYVVASTGELVMRWEGGGPVTLYAGDVRNDGILHHVAVAFTTAAYTATVDGTEVTAGSFSPSLTTATFDTVTFGGAATTAYNSGFNDCYIAHAAIHPVLVPQPRINAWRYAGILAFAATYDPLEALYTYGDLDVARVARILGYAGVVSAKYLPGTSAGRLLPDGEPANDPTTIMVSCQDIGGQPAATALTNVAASTLPGQLFVAPNGDICFTPKQYGYNQPVEWVLGTNVQTGETPVQPSYAPDYDPARVVNDIALTQLDDQSITVPQVPVLEAASIIAYGDQTYQATVYLLFDPVTLTPAYLGYSTTQDLANWIAEAGAEPHLRAALVTVDAASHPAAWPFVNQVSGGDVVTVNIRQSTANGALVSVTGMVTQTQRSYVFGSPTAATVACVVDFAPQTSVLACDDPDYGVLDGNNALSW
jgi:hypothetical protein